MTVISVIVGSTREGRFSEKPAKWILQHLKKRERIDARLLDLRDFPMPFFDHTATPATPGRPAFAHEIVQKWTTAIAHGKIIVTVVALLVAIAIASTCFEFFFGNRYSALIIITALVIVSPVVFLLWRDRLT